MNCANHTEIQATAFCRTCGKALCEQCRRNVFGTVYCEEHVLAAGVPPGKTAGAAAPPPPGSPYEPGAPPPKVYADVSPGLALFLGFIPGVGAIYNAQYAKGILHAVIWGVLWSIADSRAVRGAGPLVGIMIAAFWAYMALEAYHTARKRRAGLPVDEYSSILNLRSGRDLPVVAISLIVLGGVLLLHTLDVLDFERVARFWPVLLIGAGAYLLYGRFRGEVSDERH
jgi:hypothetical protein